MVVDQELDLAEELWARLFLGVTEGVEGTVPGFDIVTWAYNKEVERKESSTGRGMWTTDLAGGVTLSGGVYGSGRTLGGTIEPERGKSESWQNEAIGKDDKVLVSTARLELFPDESIKSAQD